MTLFTNPYIYPTRLSQGQYTVGPATLSDQSAQLPSVVTYPGPPFDYLEPTFFNSYCFLEEGSIREIFNPQIHLYSNQ